MSGNNNTNWVSDKEINDSGHDTVKMKEKKKKKKKKENIPYEMEVKRKGIHLLSLLIPIIYSFIAKDTALFILVPLAIAFVMVDILSKMDSRVGGLINKYFGKMLRKHEKKKKKIVLNGASWVLIGAAVTIAVFPKLLAVTAISILIISDILAALIGRKFGKTPLMGKSLEGTMAFIVSAMLVVAFIGYLQSAPWSFYAAGIVAAIAGGLVEAASKRLNWDDNLSIPMTVGFILWIIGYFAEKAGLGFTYLMS
ncbi:MAG: diacylglycerol/polyprenol kinase family protein [Bacteroidota bacterium]